VSNDSYTIITTELGALSPVKATIGYAPFYCFKRKELWKVCGTDRTLNNANTRGIRISKSTEVILGT